MKLVTIGFGEYEGRYRKWDDWTDKGYRVIPAGKYLKKRPRTLIVALDKDTPSSKHSYVDVRPIRKRDKRHGKPTPWEQLARGIRSARGMGLNEARKAVEKAIAIRSMHRAVRMRHGHSGTRERYIIQGLKEAEAIIKDMEKEAKDADKRRIDRILKG